MDKITDMKDCRNKNRVNIYIDNEFVCAVDKFVACKAYLEVGKVMTKEDLLCLQYEEEKETAFTKAASYVSKYRVTEKKAQLYLKDKGYGEKIIEETMEKLQKYSFVDDTKYANDYMASGLKKKGIKKLKMELKMKGVGNAIIEELDIDSSEEENSARKNAEIYMRRKEKTFENFGKLFKNLMSKGYGYDTTSKIVKEMKDGDDEDWV